MEPSARAGADDGVQLVDEEDQLVRVRADLVEDLRQALLELAAVLAARDEGADVERDDAAVGEGGGHVAVDDPLGQALDDGRLADARVADEDGVVLAAPGEDLDGLLDLVGAADHRVDVARPRLGGEVAPVLVEGGGGARLLAGGPAVGAGVRGVADLDARQRPGGGVSGLAAMPSRRCSGPT